MCRKCKDWPAALVEVQTSACEALAELADDPNQTKEIEHEPS